MGQSITMACPPSWHLESFVEFLQAVARDEAAQFWKFDGQLEVTAKDARWKLLVDEHSDHAAVAEDYATNDDLDERFRREVGALRFFTIRFDDVDVTRRLLRAIAQKAVGHSETVWIDTDYGWVLHAWELLKRTGEDARWDWRRAPTEV